MGFGNLFEQLAQKSPGIEEKLAQTAEASEASRMAKQAQDYEYQKALEQASSQAPAASSIPGIPDSTMSAAPEMSVNLNPTAPNISQADLDQFNSIRNNPSSKMDAVRQGLSTPMGAAGVLGTGAAATMLMNGGGDQTPPVVGPAPASAPVPPPEKEPELTPEEHQDKSDYHKIMAMFAPRKPAMMDLTGMQGTTLGSDETLQDAQRRRDKDVLVNQLGKAGSLIAAGLAKATPGAADGIFDENIKQAGNHVTDYKDRLSNQDHDPKSAASIAMRGMAQKMGFKFGENVSAEDIKKQIPAMESFTAHEDATAARQQTAGLAMLDRKDKAKDKAHEKDQALLMKLNEKVNSPGFQSSRNGIGKSFNTVSQASNIEALINSQPDPNNLTGQQAYEIAKSLDSMLSGSGGTTATGTEHLLPKTLMSQLAQGGQYMSNKPVGVKMGAFIEQTKHLIAREKALAQSRIVKASKTLTGGLPADFSARNKDDIDRILKVAAEANSEPDISGATQQFSPDVLNYAQTHGISPEQAQAIKNARTGK